MINLAKRYFNIGLVGRMELIKYYNEFCSPLVKPSRRYNIELGDNWCAMFVSVLAHKKGLINSNFPFEVSVREQVKIADSLGCFKPITCVAVGDLVVYDWRVNGNYNHVGIVRHIGAEDIEVIEGNYNGTVGVRVINKCSKFLTGCIKF